MNERPRGRKGGQRHHKRLDCDWERKPKHESVRHTNANIPRPSSNRENPLSPGGQQLTHHLHDTWAMAPLPGEDRASRRSVSPNKTLSPTSTLTSRSQSSRRGPDRHLSAIVDAEATRSTGDERTTDNSLSRHSPPKRIATRRKVAALPSVGERRLESKSKSEDGDWEDNSNPPEGRSVHIHPLNLLGQKIMRENHLGTIVQPPGEPFAGENTSRITHLHEPHEAAREGGGSLQENTHSGTPRLRVQQTSTEAVSTLNIE